MSDTQLEILLYAIVFFIVFMIWAIPSFIFWLIEQFHECPKCHAHRGRVISERMVKGATIASCGKKRKDCQCAKCGHKFVIYEETSRRYGSSRRSHDSDGSSNGGTFGGGTSSGGGASRSF